MPQRKNFEFKFDGGVLEFVDFLDEKEKLQNKMAMIYLEDQYILKQKNNIELECALKWNVDNRRYFSIYK